VVQERTQRDGPERRRRMDEQLDGTEVGPHRPYEPGRQIRFADVSDEGTRSAGPLGSGDRAHQLGAGAGDTRDLPAVADQLLHQRSAQALARARDESGSHIRGTFGHLDTSRASRRPAMFEHRR